VANWDATRPLAGPGAGGGNTSPPASAEIRQNWGALQEAFAGGNLGRDTTFDHWAAGDAAVPSHYALNGSPTVARVTGSLGPNACRVTSNGASAGELRQHVMTSTGFRTFFRGKQFSAVWIARGSAAGVWRPFIYDGITQVYGSYNVGTGQEALSVTRTLDAAATLLRTGVEVLASGSPNAAVDGWAIAQGGISPGLWVPGSVRRQGWTLPIQGTLVVGVTQLGFYWDAPVPCLALETRLRVGTAPTGASIIVDVKKNGTSMYTSGARPTIAISASSGSSVPDSATYNTRCLTRGDYVTVDIAQVGSTIAGADLNVQFIYRAFGAEFDPFVGAGELN
jgi:hypothetical protein